MQTHAAGARGGRHERVRHLRRPGRVANKKPTQKNPAKKTRLKKPTQKNPTKKKHLKIPLKMGFLGFFKFFLFFMKIIQIFSFETDFYEQVRHKLSFIYKK
jgi:hypothetical protein